MKQLLLILLIMLLVSGCTTPQRVLQVPVRESVQEELRQVKLEGDSTTLQMVFEHPLNAIREVKYTEGTKPTAPTLHYAILRDTIVVVAEVPEQVVEVVERTITQEVPIEVEVVREVNVLRWYQEVLIWIGAIALLYAVIRIILRLRLR